MIEQVLSDDNFTKGNCGWVELFLFPSDWNTQRYLPVTLAPHGRIGSRALRMQTNNTPAATYGGGGFVLKRLAHVAQMPNTAHVPPGLGGNFGLVKCEYWFCFGSETGLPANGYDAYAPRSIEFNLDSQYPNSSQTTVNNNDVTQLGKRAFFTVLWQQSAQSASIQNYTGQWFFGQGSGFPYGNGSYVIPTSVANVASGYYSSFPYNQNKKTLQYVAIVYDTFNGLLVSLQANALVYDLTTIPSLSGGPLKSLLAPNDPVYNANDFAGGLNPIVKINNTLSAGFPSASWLEIHRAKVSYV